MSEDPLKSSRRYRLPQCQKSRYLPVLAVEDALESLPKELASLFGRAIFAMELTIKPDLKMSRLNAEEVLVGLQEKGYVAAAAAADQCTGTARATHGM